MSRRLLCACISLFLALSISAESTTDFMVKITQAGTLEESVKALGAESIKKLTIIGQLNGTDIKYLRSDEVRNYEIDSLDLYDVTLVAGGESYYTYVNPGGDGDYFSSGTYYVYLSDHEEIEFLEASSVMGVQSKYRWYSNALPFAFAGTNIKCVILPKFLKRIGQGIFQNSSSLTEVVMADNISEIGNDAFFRCSALSTITQLLSVKRIGSRAFEDCKKLSFDLLDLSSAHRIDDSAFLFCESIKSVKLADNCESVGQNAFGGCSSLVSIDYNPDATTVYSTNSFDDTWIDKLPIEDGIIYMGHTALRLKSDEAHLPNLKFREGTLCIAHNFAVNRFYKKVELPASLKRIGDKAFYCGGSGWDGDFYTGIESLELPEGLIEIGKEAFGMYVSEVEVEDLTIPTSVKRIGGQAFYGWIKLKKLQLLGCSEVGSSVFSGCEALQHVIIGPNVHRLGDNMFVNCGNLATIEFSQRPSTSKFTIGSRAFERCSSLLSISLPEGTDSICNSAFEQCIKIATIKLPQSLIYIGVYVFSNCENLSEITIPENVTWASRVIKGSERLADFFGGCKQLKSATILCKDAGYWGYLDSLETIRFGENLKYVGESSFYSCNRIKRVYCPTQQVPEAAENAFVKWVVAEDTLYVRSNLIEEFKTTAPWSYFKWIVGLDSSSDPDNPSDPDKPTGNKSFIEYFIDNDPGYGKGSVADEIKGGVNDIEIDLTGIKPGAHLLYVRSRNENGQWSATIARPLYVRPLVYIAEIEYFFDNNDPGEGQATEIALPSNRSNPFDIEIPLGNLPLGQHQLNVRVKGDDGLWSPIASETFTIGENSGINEVGVDREPIVVYTLKGYQVKGQKGINLIRYKDGTTKKIIIK